MKLRGHSNGLGRSLHLSCMAMLMTARLAAVRKPLTVKRLGRDVAEAAEPRSRPLPTALSHALFWVSGLGARPFIKWPISGFAVLTF